MLTRPATIAITVATGVALELGIQLASGRREAWDSSLYWSVGLPVAGCVSLALGYLSRDRDWLWTFLIAPVQVMTMMVRSGEAGGLWPLAVVLSGIISVPLVIAAFIASRFRRVTHKLGA